MTSTAGRTLGGKSLDRNLEAIIIFASIALGLSVVYWLIFYLSQKGAIRFAPDRSTWGAARAYGPTAAAVISALYVGGLSSLKRLWMRVTAWKVPWWLYALALLGFPVAVLGVTYATAVFGTAPVTVGRTSPLHLLLLFSYICVIDGPLGEEIGWRGFLLPGLLTKMSAVQASLIVGLIGWLWHLPLYQADGRNLTLLFLTRYLVIEVGYSLIWTWFFIRSGYSALIPIIVHTACNYSFLLQMRIVFPTVNVPEIYFVLLTVIVAAVAAINLKRYSARPSGI